MWVPMIPDRSINGDRSEACMALAFCRRSNARWRNDRNVTLPDHAAKSAGQWLTESSKV